MKLGVGLLNRQNWHNLWFFCCLYSVFSQSHHNRMFDKRTERLHPSGSSIYFYAHLSYQDLKYKGGPKIYITIFMSRRQYIYQKLFFQFEIVKNDIEIFTLVCFWCFPSIQLFLAFFLARFLSWMVNFQTYTHLGSNISPRFHKLNIILKGEWEMDETWF